MTSSNTLMNPERSSTSQARGLPGLDHDILFAIVQYCLPANETIEVPPRPGSEILVLCQICRSFRRLVLTSPRLWTKFAFTSTKLGQHRDLFQEWLNRAYGQSSPLPISIENSAQSVFSIFELDEFILPRSSQLLRLHLCLSYEALERLFSLTSPITFPSLTDFSALCTDFQQPSILNVEPVFLSSPLRSFGLELGPPVSVRGLGIMWGELKSLHLLTPQSRFFFPISWIHTILDACQTLETCSIFLEPTTDPELPRLELPFLKSLCIHFRDPGWKTQAGIFGFLSLPALHTLEVYCQDGLAFNESCTYLKSFFRRSPLIQHLRFERTPSPGAGFSASVNSSEVVAILSLLPDLRAVGLPKGHQTNIVTVLEAILLRAICPMLESVDLTVNNGLQVIRVIQVLWREGAGLRRGDRTLKTIKLIDPKLSWIQSSEQLQTEDAEITQARTMLKELKEEGLVVLS